MPVGGFGNLIALPLQRRAHNLGNSVFVDAEFAPYDDQWAFLSSLRRCGRVSIDRVVDEAEARGRVLGVRLPVEDENADEPWRMTPSRRVPSSTIAIPLPEKIRVVLADQIWVDRTDLPPAMTARLICLAAFQNPEFYRAQAMRLSTFDKPRIISRAELHVGHVGLPRGCLDEATDLIRANGSDIMLEDHRVAGMPLMVTSSSTNAITCPHRASNWWHGARRPNSFSGCRRPSPARTVIIPSSSCDAGPVRHRVDARTQAAERGMVH